MSDEQWRKVVKEQIQKREQKKWQEEMKTKTKLRTYVLVKQELKQEKYLEVRDRWGVPELTKLRGGANRLKIEKGRYSKIPPEQRICDFCNTGEVEDEKHFLVRCPLYCTLREGLWRDIYPLLRQPVLFSTDEQKVKSLLKIEDKKLVKRVLRFVKQAMRIRGNKEKEREKQEEEERKAEKTKLSKKKQKLG